MRFRARVSFHGIVRVSACAAIFLILSATFYPSGTTSHAAATAYLGFDRNDYPGDDAMRSLRKKFSFTGYWLNNPPGAKTNSWAGKRAVVENLGFGFLVVFNGRTFAEIKRNGNPEKLGVSDGGLAVSAVRRESFPPGTIVFLDQEEGGRLFPEQRAYLHAWLDAVRSAGFGAGVYCSGIPSKEGGGATVITAEDIRQNAAGREMKYWVTNDACPPSPGCELSHRPSPAASGVAFADVWQFAQSPRRASFTGSCPANYDHDGSCYPEGGKARGLQVDLDVSSSADPSKGRSQ
jgi:hypothetical protein